MPSTGLYVNIPPQSARRLARYAEALSSAWDDFSTTIGAVDDPEVDADAEDLALAFAKLARLERLGVRFDPAFIAHVQRLKAQASNTLTFHEDDTDSDEDDDSAALAAGGLR